MTIVTRRAFVAAAVLGGAALATAGAVGEVPGPRIGAPAPDFSLTDSKGRTVSLAAQRGKTVVLEWTNHDCPFVRKHYEGAAMQALQKKWTADGVVWLTVISSAPGTQGHVSPAEADRLTAERNAAPSAVLFDPTGKVGKSYEAKVTPHMYIIKPDGSLAFMGGIDDKPSARIADLKTATNHVDVALTELKQGKPVSTTTTRPYGCTIKYAS